MLLDSKSYSVTYNGSYDEDGDSQCLSFLIEKFDYLEYQGTPVTTTGFVSCVIDFYESKVHFYDVNDIEQYSALLEDVIFKFYGECDASISSEMGFNYWMDDDFFENLIKKAYFKFLSVYQMDIYQLKCEKNLVNKTANTSLLNALGTLYGSFREEIDLINPSILFESTYFPVFNYVHISDLSRWYFVTKFTLVRNGIYRMDLHVDVLHSFMTDIYSQSGFLGRNENGSNSSLVDKRLPLKDVPAISELLGTNTSPSLITDTFKTNLTNNSLSVVLTTMLNTANYSAIDTQTILPPSGSALPTISTTQTRVTPTMVTYVLTLEQWEKLGNYLRQNDALASYIASVIFYPIDLYDGNLFVDEHDNPVTHDLWIFSTNVTDAFSHMSPVIPFGQCYITKNRWSDYMVFADCTFSSLYSGTKNFLNYEPYATYELYLPYHGFIKLNGKDFLDQRILIYYSTDFLTGNSIVYVYNFPEDRILYSSSASIGMPLPVTTTNALEIAKQKDASVNNTFLSLVGATISTVAGAISGNPIALAGGVLSGAHAVASFINTNSMLIDRANVTLGGDVETLHSTQYFYVKRTYHEPVTITESEYKKLNGYPVNNYTALSSITGYSEIEEIHYTPINNLDITTSEIDEIETLAKIGIIL